MPTYAMMNGNMVSNIIVSDNKEETELALRCTLIEFTNENPAGIGHIYDEETKKFNAPIINIQTDEEKKQFLLQKLGITQEELNILIQ